FAVAGEDRRFHPADVAHLVTGEDDRGRPTKDQRVLVLTSSMVAKPVHYRYAWARSPLGNLQALHNTDIPLATQRSDNWSMREIHAALTGVQSKSTEPLQRGERRELLEALRAEDLRRQLAEAEALIRDNKK
ncbi:MAG: hypothetical protein AAF961_01280, partial [Planctomycetota bacterium]